MTEPDWTLLFRRVDAILESQARVEQRLDALEKAAVQGKEENITTTGLVLRYAGEHIAWGGVQEQLRKIQARLDALEAKP